MENTDRLDRHSAKARLLGTDSSLVDSFIVFNRNKHQPRKRLDITIEGFARFAHGKPANVKLYLHTGLVPWEFDLRRMAEAAGIRDRLIMTDGCENGYPSVADDRLNLIYNACDLGINTSAGEGWGLVSFEHAATGAPQIVPRHSACADLWEGAAVLLPPVKTCEHKAMGMLRHFVSPDDVAAALDKLYYDSAYRQKMALAAFERATLPCYDWRRIATQWDRLFVRLLEAMPVSN